MASDASAFPEPPLTILVVEDNAIVAEALCELLTDDGYRCIVATSFAEGRARLMLGGIDILLADYHLGDGYGLDLLAGLPASAARPPRVAILISAMLEGHVCEAARSRGFTAAIHKGDVKPGLVRSLCGDRFRVRS